MKKLHLATPAVPAVILATLIMASGYTPAAWAEKTLGALGTKANAVDVFKSTCSKKTATSPVTSSFIARIRAISGALVDIQIKKGVKVAKASDPKKGDANFGPFATLKGSGDGVYILSVSKRAAGVTNYEIQTFCETTVKDTSSVTGFKHNKQAGPLITQNQ